MITTIAGRELRALFLSPLAWAVLGVIEFIMAYMFLVQVDGYLTVLPRLGGMDNAPGVTDVVVAPVLGNAAIILLLAVPLITMRLIAEERRNGTLNLYLSAPISMTQIVLGKYLGVLGFLGIMLGLIALMPLSLLLGGSLDFGKLAAGLLGLGLLLAAFTAVGLYMSTLTRHATVAGIATFGVLLLLWIIDWTGGGERAVFGYLSLLRHYESLLRGLFNSADLAYYLLVCALFLGLSVRRLDSERMGV